MVKGICRAILFVRRRLPWPFVFAKFTVFCLRSNFVDNAKEIIWCGKDRKSIPVFGRGIKRSFRVAILLWLAAPVSAEDFSGRVVAIADDDTISVMHDGRAEKVRLHGIDAPEKGQPFTNRAKQYASDLVFGKDVNVRGRKQDRYGRTIAEVFLPDGRHVNQEIVRAGLAWWFRRYAPKDRELEKLE
jgi:micrococcal nuclease